ncbi:MAG: transposase [Chloroflexota bacterium]
MEIIYLLQSISHFHTKTTWRQLATIVEAMLSVTGRVTILGISRWTEVSGSYRTIQRFFRTSILWSHLNFHLFLTHRYSPGEEIALAGDHTMVIKSEKETHGLDYFFSSIQKKAVKGLEFFLLYPINVSSTGIISNLAEADNSP